MVNCNVIERTVIGRHN